MDPDKARYARDTAKRTLAEIVDGADIFLGPVRRRRAEAARWWRPWRRRRSSWRWPIPYPEILPEHAQGVRPDCIIATGRSDYPNQVNNALCFPYIFRGALDVGAHHDQRSDEAGLRARDRRAGAQGSLRPGCSAYGGEVPFVRPRIPDPAPVRPAPAGGCWRRAVAQAAMDSGVATRPIADMDAYREKLGQFVFRTSLMMKPVFERARSERKRVAYAEGEEDVVLRAVQTVIDEGLAFPILIGRPEVIENAHRALGLRIRAGVALRADQHRRRSALQRLLAALPRAS
jgi:malate dehydrogenase (oxaloacetate-decarboxylating)(NADP+)